MKRYSQRKIPFLTVLMLCGIVGIFFCIKAFFPAVFSQEPLPNRSTQSFSQLAASFTSAKTGTLRPPSEILITSELAATVQFLHFITGDLVRGGQPVMTLSDQGGKYASQLEMAQLTIDVAQNLYDTTKTTTTQQLQQAEQDIANLQQQLHQTENDLQILITTSIEEVPTIIELEGDLGAENSGTGSEYGTGSYEGGLGDIQKDRLLTTLYSLETQLENAKLHYELLKTTTSNELDQLSFRLQTARKEYETLYTTYNNLSVRTPMAGTLGSLFVSPGEDVFPGMPLFTLIPQIQTPTIEVELTFEEYLTVLSLSEVRIVASSSGAVFTSTGVISTRSPLANENGMYTLTIESLDALPEGQTIFEVYFPITTDFFFLPKEVVVMKHQEENADRGGREGFLYVLINNEVETFPVQLGNQRNDFVEIKTPLDPDAQVLINAP